MASRFRENVLLVLQSNFDDETGDAGTLSTGIRIFLVNVLKRLFLFAAFLNKPRRDQFS